MPALVIRRPPEHAVLRHVDALPRTLRLRATCGTVAVSMTRA
jgi:hypothetical protein